MIQIKTSTMPIQVPWPNGQGSDLMEVHVAAPADQDGGPYGFGQTQAEAVVNLLNRPGLRLSL